MTRKTRQRLAMALGALVILFWLAPAQAGPGAYAAIQEGAAEGAGHGWWSVAPPVLAIALALVFHNVVLALFLGIWLGAWIVNGLTLHGFWTGMLDAFQVYVLDAMADKDHASVILFSLMIAGMVGIILKNGGMLGVVNRITPWTNTTRRAQLATSWLGIGIFFDDYANSLVVGNTMRPVTDRLLVSREKLAYLVDSTAAPVACLLFVTTWIGMEVGLIDTALQSVGATGASPYDVFLSSLAYAFYPWLAIFFVLLISYTGRDFGPMLAAERRARSTGQLTGPDAQIDESAGKDGIQAKEGQPQRAYNAVLPILVLLGTVLVGLWVTGRDALADQIAAGVDVGLRDIIGGADSYKSLMWGALLGVMAAAALSIGGRVLTLHETVDAWYKGLRSIGLAMIILVLAWSLSATTQELGTAEFLGHLLGDHLSPGFVPATVFLLSAAVAFATGTSWGTMGILMPLVFPLAWTVLQNSGVDDPLSHAALLSTVSCVLAGAVWGDHCSPISDTTILSSMVSGCDHIDHVRTQLPYAGLVGIVALLTGTLPTAFGLPWWISMLAGCVVLFTILRFVGKHSAEEVRG